MSNQPQSDQNPWVEAQERYLQTVRESQEAISEALSTWSQSFTQAGPGQNLPVGDLYAGLEQSIDQVFGFFRQLLDHNREFVRSVLQATRPLADTAAQQTEATSQQQGGQRAEQGGQRAEQGGQRAEQGGQRAEQGGQRAGSRQS